MPLLSLGVCLCSSCWLPVRLAFTALHRRYVPLDQDWRSVRGRLLLLYRGWGMCWRLIAPYDLPHGARLASSLHSYERGHLYARQRILILHNSFFSYGRHAKRAIACCKQLNGSDEAATLVQPGARAAAILLAEGCSGVTSWLSNAGQALLR